MLVVDRTAGVLNTSLSVSAVLPRTDGGSEIAWFTCDVRVGWLEQRGWAESAIVRTLWL